MSELRALTESGTQAMTNKAVGLKAGTAEAGGAPLKLVSGTNLTTPEAGAIEYDGVNTYITNETTAGRGLVQVQQHFKLTANGSNISTIANFFGTNSNIPLVSGGYYEIEIIMYFTKNTAGTVTWTLTNSAAPTSQNIWFQMSPVTGIVAPPGTATMLEGNYFNDATAARTIVTASISNSAVMFTRIVIHLANSTGTSLKIQATAGAGTITPGRGSTWNCKRIPSTNVGTFAA